MAKTAFLSWLYFISLFSSGLGKMFNQFKAYDKRSPEDKPPQYSRENRAHGISEYLDAGQLRAFAKRFSPDNSQDMFDGGSPFGSRGSNLRKQKKSKLSELQHSRRLMESSKVTSNYSFGVYSNEVLGGGVLLSIAGIFLLVLRKQYRNTPASNN